MIEPDKKVIRRALPMKIVHNSTPRFSFEGGEYFTGGPDETAYAFGMPNWVYDRRDSRPLKLSVAAGEELMSASKIHAAFNDDTIERFNLLKQPKPGRLRNNAHTVGESCERNQHCSEKAISEKKSDLREWTNG